MTKKLKRVKKREKIQGILYGVLKYSRNAVGKISREKRLRAANLERHKGKGKIVLVSVAVVILQW